MGDRARGRPRPSRIRDTAGSDPGTAELRIRANSVRIRELRRPPGTSFIVIRCMFFSISDVRTGFEAATEEPQRHIQNIMVYTFLFLESQARHSLGKGACTLPALTVVVFSI